MSCTCSRFYGNSFCPICQRKELEVEEAAEFNRPVYVTDYPYCHGCQKPFGEPCNCVGQLKGNARDWGN